MAKKIESLKEWKEAEENFSNSLALVSENENKEAGISYARCLTRRSKFSKAFNYLTDNQEFLSNLPEFWLLLSIANQKNMKYGEAKHAITEALNNSKFKNYEEIILKQKRIIDCLSQNNLENRLDAYKKTELKIEETWYKKRTSSESASYNILSIDGGGVRGIIPAMWLCEIEKQAKRPISHLFNMMSGTSVGAVIASALSMPYISTLGISEFKPHYSASDIVQLFKHKSKEIFSAQSFFQISSWTSKYLDKGRNNLFQDYFKNSTLKDSLCDLVVTAVNQNDTTNTHLFNRYDVRRDSLKDESLLNVVMASTAAPTFFPVYTIRNRGNFIDGGVTTNNPARAAYNEALRYGINSENIFVLALGTGKHVLDPFNPEKYGDQLFWAMNFNKISLAAQESDVDRDMCQNLGNKYERWQIYFDNPVNLDDYNKLDYLAELASQYIEELKESDENKMKKLIEHLLKNQ